MPARNGSGPHGRGAQQGGSPGQGRFGGNRPGSGPGGNCICPNCGVTIPHKAGVPCTEHTCPECETTMIKE